MRPFSGGPYASCTDSRRRQDRRTDLRIASRIRQLQGAAGGRRRRGRRGRGARARRQPTSPPTPWMRPRPAPSPGTSPTHPVDAVISSLPYYCNVAVAEAARKAGTHYFDLTEDVEVTRAVRAIAVGASEAFVPQCGLAPGFISIAAAELITPLRRAARGEAARRRPAAAPEQRPQVLPHLVHRGTDQRVRQSLPGGQRRPAGRGGAARGTGGDRDRRHAATRPSTPPAASARSPRPTARTSSR